METKQAAQTNLQAAKDKRAVHKCQACGTGYKRESNFARHVYIPITDAKCCLQNENENENERLFHWVETHCLGR
jgi:hypothetical protein